MVFFTDSKTIGERSKKKKTDHGVECIVIKKKRRSRTKEDEEMKEEENSKRLNRTRTRRKHENEVEDKFIGHVLYTTHSHPPHTRFRNLHTFLTYRHHRTNTYHTSKGIVTLKQCKKHDNYQDYIIFKVA